MGKPNFKFRKDQNTEVKRYKARGYAVIDNQHNGVMLGMIDGDGFKRRVVVDIRGNVQRYRPIKATTYDRQRLPKYKKEFKRVGT